MNTLATLFSNLFRRFPLHFLLLIGFVVAQALVNALSVVAISPITDFLMDRADPENASHITLFLQRVFTAVGLEFSLLSVFIAFAVLMGIYGLTGIATQYAVLRIKYDVLRHLLLDTLGRFFRARFLFFNQGEMGVLLNTFQTEMKKVSESFGHMATVFANLIQCTVFLAVPLTLNFKLTVVFLFSAFAISLPLWLIRRIAYALGQAETETANALSGTMYETFSASKIIIGYGCRKNRLTDTAGHLSTTPTSPSNSRPSPGALCSSFCHPASSPPWFPYTSRTAAGIH